MPFPPLMRTLSRPSTTGRRFLSTTSTLSTSTPSPSTSTPSHPIRRVSTITSEKPLIRKTLTASNLIKYYGTVPSVPLSRPPPENNRDGPLVRRTGANWRAGLGPTIRKEYDVHAPEEPDKWIRNPPRIVIGADKLIIGSGKEGAGKGPYKRPKMPELKVKDLTVEQHRIEWPQETTWVDTHCHLSRTLEMIKERTGSAIPSTDLHTLVAAIFPHQVTAVVDIHCDLPDSNSHAAAAALPWPEHFKYYFSKGVHPHNAMLYNDEVHEAIVAAMSHPQCVAWGECGLDYFRNDVSTHPTQRSVFARQLTAAVALGKPLIIHTRDADDDTLALLREHVPKTHPVHVHCFTAGPVLSRALMKEWDNAYIGLTGVVSYRDMEHVKDLIKSGEIPVERLLLETDSPYMVPRGAYAWLMGQQPELARKRFAVSHAGMIPFTAQKALEEVNAGREERGEEVVGLEAFLDLTRRSAGKVYGIEV